VKLLIKLIATLRVSHSGTQSNAFPSLLVESSHRFCEASRYMMQVSGRDLYKVIEDHLFILPVNMVASHRNSIFKKWFSYVWTSNAYIRL
jgi:hypothetical protein